MEVNKLGNIGNGKTQSRTVYSIAGVCPTLIHGMDKGNTIPYIVVRSNKGSKKIK